VSFLDLPDTGLYSWVILPLLIMVARICDVSIGTIRLMFLARGDKLITPLLGFFEVIVWLLAMREIMQNLANPVCYIAYGAGFGLGNLVGIIIEEKIAIGKRIIRVITKKEATDLISSISSAGFSVTTVPAEGSRGRVSIVSMVVDRNDIEQVISLIKAFNPRAFYSIEDIRFASESNLPADKRWKQRFDLKSIPVRFRLNSFISARWLRKGK
jgi:uncharacterized protein YebE (UPF0316 family)